MKKILKNSGETLIEVIISLSVLMMTGVAATAMIISSIQTTALSENYLIAQNLATEAVEAFKSIRGTNWLIYPGFEDKCWMVSKHHSNTPLSDPLNECAGYMINADDYLVISQVEDITTEASYLKGKWVTSDDLGMALNLEGGMDAGVNTDYALYLVDEGGVQKYRHGTPSGEEKFYREIYVKSINITEVELSVRIQWFQGAKLHTFLNDDVRITNYL